MHRRLLIRPGAIGDCILALPELEAARADYTEVWAPRAVVPLIQFADRTRAIADTGLDSIGVRDDASLRELESFDSIYSWYGFNFQPFRDAVRNLPFTFFPALPVNVAGTPRIRVPDLPKENLAILHPFSGSAKKNWPLENFRDLASRLSIPAKFCAGPEDRFEHAARIENLFDLACFISTASVYIGNDSGITHLAAAAGTPVVAIFLATDPRIWRPRGDRVIVLEHPTVGQVVAAANAIRR